MKSASSNNQYELFFMISPPAHIKNDVSILKTDVHNLIGHNFEDRYSTAHLSLFKCAKPHESIKYLLLDIRSTLRYINPFNIFIKDMNIFHHGSNRTIYLDIINKGPLRDLFERLVKKGANFVPHITISRNISSEDFLKTLPFLNDFRYSQHFLCDRITVLTRSENPWWMHYADIPFGE